MLKDLSAVELMRSFTGFVTEGCGVVLNQQQLDAAAAILESVCRGEGSSFRLNFSHADQQALATHLLVLPAAHVQPCRTYPAGGHS